jgi:hypothetical protein
MIMNQISSTSNNFLTIEAEEGGAVLMEVAALQR